METAATRPILAANSGKDRTSCQLRSGRTLQLLANQPRRQWGSGRGAWPPLNKTWPQGWAREGRGRCPLSLAPPTPFFWRRRCSLANVEGEMSGTENGGGALLG